MKRVSHTVAALPRRGFALAPVLTAAAAISAQIPAAPPRVERGAILGTLTDTALNPLSGADISLVGTTLRVTSDAAGRFAITALPAGEYVLAVRRLRFQPTINLIEVPKSDTLRLALMLLPAVQELAPVSVSASDVSLRKREFEERRRQGVGEFFTEQEIEDRNATSIADLLRQSKTLNVASGPKASLTARSGRDKAYQCYMQVYLDGVPMAQPSSRPDIFPFDLRRLPSPKEIMGIEIYAGSATVPDWLPQGPQSAHSGCGVVLIWSKTGS